VTASAIVAGFLERVGHPEEHRPDGPFYVMGHGLVTEPKLTALVWTHFKVSPKRRDIADAYATLVALARDERWEPQIPSEPEPKAKRRNRRARSNG
jgi:hypothetical protein